LASASIPGSGAGVGTVWRLGGTYEPGGAGFARWTRRCPMAMPESEYYYDEDKDYLKNGRRGHDREKGLARAMS